MKEGDKVIGIVRKIEGGERGKYIEEWKEIGKDIYSG